MRKHFVVQLKLVFMGEQCVLNSVRKYLIVVHGCCVYSSTQDGETRGKSDFIILRDKGQKTNKLIPVDDLITRLHDHHLKGHFYQDTIDPGMNKSRHFRDAVHDSDFIICTFDADDISPQHISQITDSHNIKTKQKIDECIIPVFIDREHESALVTRYPQLMFIKLYEAAYVEKDDWIAKIIHRMTTPSLSELKQYLTPTYSVTSH